MELLFVPVPPPVVSVTVTATGSATVLGQFAVSIPHSVNVITRTAIGDYLFVAANGDTLTGTFIGHSLLTDVPNVIAITEDVTITGGTVAGRSRKLHLRTSVRFRSRYDHRAFEGTITSPSAARR